MQTQDMSKGRDGWKPTKEELVEFLGEQRLCVISTLADDGRPQTATVAFSETAKLEIIIGTDVNSRKSQNMQRDPRVALTVTDPDNRITVQIEGKAKLLTKEKFQAIYSARHYQKLPFSLPFKDIKEQVNFAITPTWIRFSDCKPYPWVTTEYSFTETP